MGGACAVCTFLWSSELLLELLDSRLDVSLEVFGSFVLRNSTQHFLQAVEPLVRLSGLTLIRFGLLVFRADVGRHPELPDPSDSLSFLR